MNNNKLRILFFSFLFTIVFLVFAGLVNAQKPQLKGSWLITKVEAGGEVHTPYLVCEFLESGQFFVLGMEAGTWKYKKDSNALVLTSDLFEEFKGEGIILDLSETGLITEKEGEKTYYLRINESEIAAGNINSGLMGKWEFKGLSNPEGDMLVTFTEPDEFSILKRGEGYESRMNGTWIFQEEDMSLLMTGLREYDVLKGKSTIILINPENLELENRGKILRANKKASGGLEIERLTFKEEDFFTEDGEYRYEADEERLPWRGWSDFKMALIDINQLVYSYSSLLEGSEVFDSKILVADVHASLEEDVFNIDYIFYGYDRDHLPEDAAFPESTEYTGLLYPLSDDIYRIVGVEQLTTPAGTFECTVVEAADYDGMRKKMWLIKNRPGIYAKIIEEDPDENFGHYWIYELQEIK